MPKLEKCKNVLIVANQYKTSAKQKANNIKTFLKNEGVEAKIIFLDEYDKDFVAQASADMVVALGGDGTMLKVIHDFYTLNAPFFGINNGHLGFITPYTKENWMYGLKYYLEKKQFFSNRILLSVVQKEKGKVVKSDIAVNEAYLHRPDSRAVIRIKAKINNEVFATQLAADGIIIATPTGSTSYSMAAGASVLSAEMNAFLFMPNNPFMAIDRALVFSGENKIEIALDEHTKTDQGIIDIDGRYFNNFKRADVLELSVAKEKVRIIKNPTLSEYERIGNKLAWHNS